MSVPRYYHCISRCVRRAFLCGEGLEHRKQWIEDRLETLSPCFAVAAICCWSITPVDCAGKGRLRVSREVASILDRLGTSVDVWGQRIQKLFGKGATVGQLF